VTRTHVAARVGDRTFTEAEVETRVERLRRGPLAPRLPRPGTADARNLRRWVVQVMTYEAVVEAEAAALNLPPRPPTEGRLSLVDALRMGGVTAAVLTSLPVAPAVRERVTADVAVPEPAVRDYYARNRDLHPGPYEAERPAIEHELHRAAADRHFVLWLERRHAESVTLMPGYEHPADPRHADATHRH
jgi:[acyl-carrier-protein] S-malonyltransferase